MEIRLLNLNNKSKDLLDKEEMHRIQLGFRAENTNRVDVGTIKTEDGHLEEEMAQFVKLFRENRNKVYTISEYIIVSEKSANIMAS